MSGFSEKFFFYGFFPTKLKDIQNDLKSLSNLNSCIIFFISSKKFNKTIPKIKENFSDRMILICREMTKYYEEYLRYNVKDLKTFDENLKGELTIVLSEKKTFKLTSSAWKMFFTIGSFTSSFEETIKFDVKKSDIPIRLINKME